MKWLETKYKYDVKVYHSQIAMEIALTDIEIFIGPPKMYSN